MHHGEDLQYIEATLEDIETANRIANDVLGRSTDDLPPQTQRLLSTIDAMVKADCERQGLDRSDYRFSRRDVRDFTGWGNTQLKVHLKRLEDLEYLLVHRGGRGQSFVYELLNGLPTENGPKFLAGLIDVEQLRRERSGLIGEKSGYGRPQVGVKSALGRGDDFAANTNDSRIDGDVNGEVNQNGHQGVEQLLVS